MAKLAHINIRVDSDLKKSTEAILGQLGMNTTQAITLYLKQIEQQNGIPFEVKIPNKETLEAFAEPISEMDSASSVDEMFEKLNS